MNITENKVIAAESTHWYSGTGEPVYTVIAKGTGLPRPTTLKDARTMNLLPSVSGILNLAAKPGLDIWKQQQVLLSALTLLPRSDETEQAYVERILKDSQEQGLKARELGTSIHTAIEQSYRLECPLNHAIEVSATKEAVLKHFGDVEWTAEKSFAHKMGYGGKCDLMSRDGIVIDFKTSKFTSETKTSTLGYDENQVQLSAYREGFGMPTARCANVFISTTQPGLVFVKEYTEDEMKRGWAMFQALLAYFQAKNKYAPVSL
jgi:hypothetical protein